MKDGKTLQFQKDAQIDLSKNIHLSTEETCLQCHNDQNPTWNPEKYMLENRDKVGFDFKQAWAKINHWNPNKPHEEKQPRLT